MFEVDNRASHKIISKTEPIASLSLQMILTFDKSLLSWLLFFTILLLGFYKQYNFGLPHKTLEVEVLILICLHFVNQVRLYVAMKSNKTEKSNSGSVILFLLTSVVVFAGLLFFMVAQQFTILFESFIIGVALILSLIEFAMMTLGFLNFSSLESS